MTGLLDQKLTGMGITLHSASYTPGQSSTWAARPPRSSIRPPQENITAPIPQTQFEALFLPDSWKNMNLLTTSLMYNGEDRLVLLGTTLWEQGLDGKTVAEPDRYALAVFPAAWDATQAPAALRAPGTDFWVALGYDFVRFAVRMAFDSRPPAATVNAQAANMKIQWAMAPLSWDEKGIAHQKLHLFQPGANGMEPLDLTRFRNMREAILQRAAPAHAGLPTVDEQGNSLIPGLPGMSAGPAVLNTPRPRPRRPVWRPCPPRPSRRTNCAFRRPPPAQPVPPDNGAPQGESHVRKQEYQPGRRGPHGPNCPALPSVTRKRPSLPASSATSSPIWMCWPRWTPAPWNPSTAP